jgi:hypothetical protein
MNALKVVGMSSPPYPERCEVLLQVLETARVVAFVVLVEHLEGLRAAGREEKVVPADLVPGDGEHRGAAVGVEHVAGGLVDSVVVVDGAARREPLGSIGPSRAARSEGH